MLDMTATVQRALPAEAAALHRRVAALAIDSALYFVAVNVVVRATGGELLELSASASLPIFNLAWALAYEVGFLLLWSATPGKRLLGIHVNGSGGQRIRPVNAVIRVGAFHFFFLSFFLGDAGPGIMGWISLGIVLVNLAMVLTDDQHRALHDRIAGTRVVRGTPSKSFKVAN
jgi:uncharacterized RDD family membrane protein YckC